MKKVFVEISDDLYDALQSMAESGRVPNLDYFEGKVTMEDDEYLMHAHSKGTPLTVEAVAEYCLASYVDMAYAVADEAAMHHDDDDDDDYDFDDGVCDQWGADEAKEILGLTEDDGDVQDEN